MLMLMLNLATQQEFIVYGCPSRPVSLMDIRVALFSGLTMEDVHSAVTDALFSDFRRRQASFPCRRLLGEMGLVNVEPERVCVGVGASCCASYSGD